LVFIPPAFLQAGLFLGQYNQFFEKSGIDLTQK